MKTIFAGLLTFMLLTGLFAGTFETSFDADGQGNWNTLFLFRNKLADMGFTAAWLAEEGSWEIMAGGNVRGFSIGHLDDSGLATEIRNPGADALSRLSERTTYRADPRSDSRSRMGFSFSGYDSRVVFGLERRESIDAIFALGVPLDSGPWKFEFLGEGGNLREPENDDSWYASSDWQAAGPFGLLSARLRYLPGAFSTGFSAMLSGGSSLAPGWLASLSANYTKGPWRIRGRGVAASPLFRNADGELLNEPLGLAADWRYRPNRGFQFAAEYDFALTAQTTGSVLPEDLCSAAIGWSFDETLISLETDWNRAFFPLPPDENSPACRRIRGTVDWDRGFFHLGLAGDWEPQGESELRGEVAAPTGETGLLEGYAELYGTAEHLYLDTQIRWKFSIGRNKFISTLLIEDIMQRRVDPSGPAADISIELRWIRQFG